MPNELIAYCGLYCGACSFKVAFEENNREHIIRMPAYYDRLKNEPLEFCHGCRLENQCGDCSIRDCARDREIEYCSLCDDFPCKILKEFNNDGKPHHAESISNLNLLKDIGKEKWLELQKEKWTCTKCNSRYSWYLKQCQKC
ncbi:DUF3795 domain-containing protein [Geosporobacter ferrireducens]|uniref:DUF3795 domain-containing protein n=1 Tax=Geosporobacter ferrireducens TaxID=1424294 RepID=A0A1D8GMY6_9FIRM|nr:DUF3795 domain-containing protein [Geosporobacter ferrireducens]AOT72227.1 hypothetical protein Gferi_23390 [Geosporobacter ferrireducens]MTI56178.1 DUF3795 domain-containing protein [Geosporobacter ferrireducens]